MAPVSRTVYVAVIPAYIYRHKIWELIVEFTREARLYSSCGGESMYVPFYFIAYFQMPYSNVSGSEKHLCVIRGQVR